MARKNLLASITGSETPKTDSEARHDYARRGASRSMMISIDEMAENAKKMIAGEAIVDLDVDVLDQSFVTDRIEGEDEDFVLLREAIREHGQSTPILVRPHPRIPGRYMIVFGHRRARVAKELGIPVRSVIKNLEDIAHIIAQGQENTARANLSFIEKALFAKKLLDMGQSKDTIKSALTIDDTLMSRMLSVAETVPAAVIEAIGAARTVGRDRWEELKKQVKRPAKRRPCPGDCERGRVPSQGRGRPVQLSPRATESGTKEPPKSGAKGDRASIMGAPKTRRSPQASATLETVSASRSNRKMRVSSADLFRPTLIRSIARSRRRSSVTKQETEPQKKKAPERRRPEAFL